MHSLSFRYNITHSFLNFAVSALVDERELHARFLSSVDCNGIKPSPACVAYTDYLMGAALTAPLEEGIAALLPCFWIYREVGREIALRTAADNPYREWIESYSSEEFSEGTTLAIAILDEVADHSSEEGRLRMKHAFQQSSLFERHFWNDAYASLREPNDLMP